MECKRGFSFLEIVIAMVIMGLIIGPMIMLLSNTNKSSSYSVYEIMAAIYATEVCEQLLNYNTDPGYDVICNAAGVNIKSLLEGLNPQLNDTVATKVKFIKFPHTEMGIFVSPLFGYLVSRNIYVEPVSMASVPPSDRTSLGDYYKVIVKIGWNLPGEKTTPSVAKHFHESIIFVRRK